MRVSEGNLTQQYYCDYLAILAEDILPEKVPEEVRWAVHENIVFRNLFLHRISVDGGFHARVLDTLLSRDEDRSLLQELLRALADADFSDMLPVFDWLKAEYGRAVACGDLCRKLAVSALLRSYISGTNQAAEIFAGFRDLRPETWWRLQTRRLTISEVKNPEIYFGVGRRPFWHEFPLDRYAAVSAGCPDMLSQEAYDAVVCIAGAWFSSLTREEMLTWLNMPPVTVEEWGRISAPLLKLDSPDAAMSTANWLYASGSYDAAIDLYANISLAYPGTPAESLAFELMGTILRKNGDFDNAFEAYKNAFLSGKNAGEFQIALGLKNLCEVGEDLGEDMREYYVRILGIAEGLASDERQKLYLELASSCRRRKAYAEEYQYLEKILSEESPEETIFSAAMSRLAEMNARMNYDGSPDAAALAVIDAEDEAAVAKTRGDAAYFGFDPRSAMFWYTRSGASPEVSSALFRAAVSGGYLDDARRYAGTSMERAMLRVLEGASPASVVHELNTAVTAVFTSRETAGDEAGRICMILQPVFLFLGPERSVSVATELVRRSTRDDERACVCLGVSRTYLDMGMPDEARGMLRAALRANPSRAMRARLFVELGWMEYEAGSYPASADAYLACLKISETFPAAWAGLAKTRVCEGRYAEALSAAEKATLQNPTSQPYQHLRAALAVVSSAPGMASADRMFVLPEPGYLQAAAAVYAEHSSAGYSASAWDACSVNEVVPFRS